MKFPYIAEMNFKIKNTYWIFVVLPFFFLFFLFLEIGPYRYGANLDNYGMLHAWQLMISKGIYEPSRFQGNLPSELAMGYLASLLGPIGANGLSLILSLISAVFIALLFLIVERTYLLVGLTVATIVANPFWAMAATTSMDYNHPIPLYLGGLLLLLSGNRSLAAVSFAVAAGIRISYAPMGLAAIIWPMANEFRTKKGYLYFEPLIVFLSVFALIYLPVFISSHLSLSFLASARPTEQGLLGLLARFSYKSIYLYGVVGTITVASALILSRKQIFLRQPDLRQRDVLRLACLAAILFNLVMFLYIPVRIQYLMPVLFAVAGLLLLGRTQPWLLSLIVVAELSYWFISIDVLEVKHRYSDPCMAVQALEARFAPHIAPGITLGEITGETKEILCFPGGLVKAPLHISDRLPTP